MTDRETLFIYRMNEAEEALTDTRKMLESGVGARSVVNRAYYAIFYGIIALFIHENVEHKTSKHSGVISIFDKSIVHTGKMGKEYSRMLHRIFDARQESGQPLIKRNHDNQWLFLINPILIISANPVPG